MTSLLLIHAAATLAMAGLIWFVQVVHYPLFPHAKAGDFRAFAKEHQRRTACVVIPLMLAEAGTATLLLISDPSSPLLWLGWLLLLSVWISTALIQAPIHRRLAGGYDARRVRRLVVSNWWRTIAWTARAGVALELIRQRIDEHRTVPSSPRSEQALIESSAMMELACSWS